jgi:hypothetical protein
MSVMGMGGSRVMGSSSFEGTERGEEGRQACLERSLVANLHLRSFLWISAKTSRPMQTSSPS